MTDRDIDRAASLVRRTPIAPAPAWRPRQPALHLTADEPPAPDRGASLLARHGGAVVGVLGAIIFLRAFWVLFVRGWLP